MPYRFAKPNSHSFMAFCGTLTAMRETLAQWYGKELQYSLDEFGEGWVKRGDGSLLGYIDVGPAER